MMDEVPEGFRSGFVVLIGRPNVGKSTLVNTLIGEQLASTSPVPQTTRRRLMGILSRDDAQVVFVDTPGIHDPRHPLGQMMVAQADQALEDADVVLVMVDCTRPPGEEDQLALKHAQLSGAPKLLVINKIDRAGGERSFETAFSQLAELDGTFRTSAISGEGVPELLADIVARLPEGPPFFPPDQISDVVEREIAADIVREAAMQLLHQELPHAVAVQVDEWKERDNGMIYIHGVLYVERESQKGMVIGRGGQTLKAIGTFARERLQNWLEQRVYLELHVKVLKNWRKDENALRQLGFKP